MDNDQFSSRCDRILPCAEIEKHLDSYLDGEIDQSLKRNFEQHLTRCEACSSLVTDCQHILQVAKNLSETVVPQDVRKRLRERLADETGYPFGSPKVPAVKAFPKASR